MKFDIREAIRNLRATKTQVNDTSSGSVNDTYSAAKIEQLIANIPSGGVEEAPIDTKQYGRQDGAWTEVTAGGHTQNTDTGTTGNTFTVDSDSTTGKIIVDVALGAADLSLTLTNEALTSTSKTITFPNATGTVSLLALGENSTDAYRGDRGKTAYDHSQEAHAPNNADRTATVIFGAEQAVFDSVDIIGFVQGSTEELRAITYENFLKDLKSYFDTLYTPL